MFKVHYLKYVYSYDLIHDGMSRTNIPVYFSLECLYMYHAHCFQKGNNVNLDQTAAHAPSYIGLRCFRISG